MDQMFIFPPVPPRMGVVGPRLSSKASTARLKGIYITHMLRFKFKVCCLLTKRFFLNYFHQAVKCTYLYLNIYTNIQIVYSTNKLTTWNCSQHYLQDVSIFLTEIQWKMHCIPKMNNAYWNGLYTLLVLSTGYSTWVTGLEFTKHNN